MNWNGTSDSGAQIDHLAPKPSFASMVVDSYVRMRSDGAVRHGRSCCGFEVVRDESSQCLGALGAWCGVGVFFRIGVLLLGGLS